MLRSVMVNNIKISDGDRKNLLEYANRMLHCANVEQYAFLMRFFNGSGEGDALPDENYPATMATIQKIINSLEKLIRDFGGEIEEGKL